MIKRRANAGPARNVADLFPESMRKFGLAGVYDSCESAGCVRRARASCPECGGEHCLAHAAHPEHGGRRPAAGENPRR